MKGIYVLVWLLAGAWITTCNSGDITGIITLKGTPPPEVRVDLIEPAYQNLAAKYPNGLTSRHYVVGPDGGLKNVLVYVVGDFKKRRFELPETPVVLDHVDGFYQPCVLGVQVGQAMRLRSTDQPACSFHAVTRRNAEFSALAIGAGIDRRFTNSEVAVRFKCDLHPWNYAYVGVFDHPFFSVTDEIGRFRISGVPVGRYMLEMFHPKSGRSSREIEVGKNELTVHFTVLVK